MPAYADIAIALPLDKTFQYRIPQRLGGEIAIGKRVFVPFGPRTVVGYVVALTDAAEVAEPKEILRVIDKEPMLSGEMLALTKWIKDTYYCSWGEAIEAAVPSGVKKGKESLGARTAEGVFDHADYAATVPHQLTDEQTAALATITAAVDRCMHTTFLLHGVTASGKTEVYLQAIEKVLEHKRQTIVMVPEISLTPQTIERFVARFGSTVAVIHSRLTAAKRFLEWKKIREGRADIVVGPRSAIFSPLSRLGLIIIDEEHETSYKQDDVPRYHVREVAEERARLNRCPLILGSATPSLEAYHRAKEGRYTFLHLTKRVDGRLLPKVKIVDMRMELATRKRIVIFSKIFLDAVDRALKAGRQAMIFLNRRGFSTFLNCKKCGFVMKCKRCDTSLVYHFEEKKLFCHYCDYTTEPPDICPQCRSGYIKYIGLGTEKVESELSRAFSHARIARMDSDTTAKRGSHDRILADFRSGKTQLLVGTQMIAKGHDFPQVTVVGVVSADVSLNIPDFRAGERTFNLLTQVAGRAGRGDDSGEVVVQTYAPGHYAVLAAAKHDYEKFYAEEIIARKELVYPPFTNLVKVTVRARSDETARLAATALACAVKEEAGEGPILISGAVPAPLLRLRGYFRYNILLKGQDRAAMCALLKKVLAVFRKPHGCLVAVDVDPMAM